MPDQDDYRDFLGALLPEGPFWAGFRDVGGRGQGVLAAEAEGLAEIDARARDLIREAHPSTVIEMLPARETEAGLPDSCLPANAADQERRLHLVARWVARGGASIAYFKGLAAQLGYTITVTEQRPFRCGLSGCGSDHQCGDEKQRFHWRIQVPGPRITMFRCGQSRCGSDQLGFLTRAQDLECVIRRVMQSHTILHFDYEGI